MLDYQERNGAKVRQLLDDQTLISNPTLAESLYERLMAVSREAFSARLFNVAYHALTAALHCARTLPTDDALHEVERVATEQLAWIDQNAPEYEHSTQSAAQRNHESIFLVLAHQAARTVQTREFNRRRENLDRSGATTWHE